MLSNKKTLKQILNLSRSLLPVVFLLVLAMVVGGRSVVQTIVSDEASSQSSNQSDFTDTNPQTLSQPSFETFDQAEQIPTSLSEDLQYRLDEFANTHAEASFGVVVSDLNGQFEASINPTQSFNAASLYKTLAAYKVLQLVDRGDLSIDTPTSAGSVERCIELAITVSDNPCGIALQSLARPYETDVEASSWGYRQTTLSGYYPQTSALDQSRLFSDIYGGKRLSSESRELLLTHLSNQQILDRTPEYDGALYLKTGDLGGNVNSSALITTSETVYMISVLTDNWTMDLPSRYSAVEDIHSEIHEVITQNEQVR